MKRVFLWVALVGTLQAQSVTVTAPASNQNVSGYSGFSFTSVLANAPSVSYVCYTVDAYPAYNPGLGALSTAGCSTTPPYSLPFNSFWVSNGPHQVIATAYDSLGNQVAASAPAAFSIVNTWPVACSGSAPAITVTPSTAITSNWSGMQSLALALTGACSADSVSTSCYVDGIANNCAQIDTTQFSNGPHVVAGILNDNDNGTSYSCQGNVCTMKNAGEWSATVQFANGAAGMEPRLNAHEVFLAPGAAFNLGCTLLNTDGSMASAPICDYADSNPAVATTNSSGLVTAIAKGNSQVTAMVETVSGSDLKLQSILSIVSSVAHPFKNSQTGSLLKITGGTNWLPGLYTITHVDLGPNPPQATLSANAATSTSAVGGSFTFGPSRTSWVFVWPTNTLAHFSQSGTILNTYDPANSFFAHSMFFSIGCFSDVPYSPGCPAELNSSGYNTVEAGSAYTSFDQIGSDQSAYQAAQTSYVNNTVSQLSLCPRCKLAMTGDNFARSDVYLFNATRGIPSTFTPPALQYMFASWIGKPVPVLWNNIEDEINSSWDHKPLEGPLTFGGGAQSGLTQIVATGGVCAVSWTDHSTNANHSFIISGSVTTGMNSNPGSVYAGTNVTGNSFNFNCPNVPNGTYNNSNDSALTIEPYGVAWYNGNTDYIHYDAFASIVTQANAAGAGRMLLSAPNAAGTTCASVRNWNGNGTQSIAGIGQVGDFATLYWSHVAENYLIGRISSNSLINPTNGQGEGFLLRTQYGCFNPAKPIVILTQGTPAGFGFQGYQAQIASIVDGMVTFTAPHGIYNILPDVTRLSITGASNAIYNTNLLVTACPTATTCNVVYSVNTFSGNGTGGTVTFPSDGFSLALKSSGTSISASSSYNLSGTGAGGSLAGSSFNLASTNATLTRHRGQFFTLSGVTGAANFNTTTFWYRSSQPSMPSAKNFYNEVPSGSSTGGAANILTDNTYVKGRGGSQQYTDYQPRFTFASVMEAVILRAAGQRVYQLGGAPGVWSDQAGGFVGSFESLALQWPASPEVANQLLMFPHWETGPNVPVFHSNSLASLLITANQKYILQPSLNSPDYGELIDCGARAGSDGDILMCINLSDGPQTVTFDLTPYLQAGQQIGRYISNWLGITFTTLNAGTTSDTLTLQPDDAAFYVFPTNFATELQQPVLSVRLADVTNATKVVIHYNYDLYYLDTSLASSVDCGTGTACFLPVNRNIGTVYYRILYLDTNGKVLAQSDVQTL